MQRRLISTLKRVLVSFLNGSTFTKTESNRQPISPTLLVVFALITLIALSIATASVATAYAVKKITDTLNVIHLDPPSRDIEIEWTTKGKINITGKAESKPERQTHGQNVSEMTRRKKLLPKSGCAKKAMPFSAHQSLSECTAMIVPQCPYVPK